MERATSLSRTDILKCDGEKTWKRNIIANAVDNTIPP